MIIEATEFGRITIDGKVYEYDVVIHCSGKVEKRKKKLSKKEYGTSHIVSKQEVKFVYEKGCGRLIVGTGQYGNLRLSDEAVHYLDKRGCEVLTLPTPEAIQAFNRKKGANVGLFHVTC
jgi:hypothetical protein